MTAQNSGPESPQQRTRQEAVWLWSKVSPEPNTGCWLWTGATNGDGRCGQFKRDKKKIIAHREAWEIVNGPVPHGMFVLHRCLEVSCINPEHLFLGDSKDNRAQRVVEPIGLAERFWRKVRKANGNQCWVWIGTRNNYGYGMIRERGWIRKYSIASRVAWALQVGPIPAGLHVLHRCDNPPCVNPDHLFLGTIKDNMRDMAAKGRAPGVGKGSQRKLTAELVKQIRAAKEASCRALARTHGVSRRTIQQVIDRETWASVESEEVGS